MYPFRRLIVELATSHRLSPLPLDGEHVTHLTCMPWDLDGFLELNNGRTLTLLDIPRFGYFARAGMFRVLRGQRWGLSIAGVSVRYRRRIRAFDRMRIHTTMVGRDARFLYLHQSIWHRDEAANSALFRFAALGTAGNRGGGILPTDTVVAAFDQPDWNPPLPDWVAAWSEAEAQRPWPPETRLPS